MSRVYEVQFDAAALVALEEAALYIEEQSGRDRASSWLKAMRSSIQRLETSPRAFPVVSVRRGRPVRSKVVVSHRVYYIIEEAAHLVYILDVVHTARETKLAEYREDL